MRNRIVNGNGIQGKARQQHQKYETKMFDNK